MRSRLLSLAQTPLRRFLTPLAVAAAFAAVTAASAAETGTITGRVLNQGTGQYIRNAVVSVAGTNISTLSEAGGNFRLLGVPAGSNRISVSYPGLDPVESVVVVGAGQTVEQDFNLTSRDYDPEIVTMGEFVVAAEKEGDARAIAEQREAINYKTVIASDAFGDVSEGNIGEFLKLMPGVSLDYVEADVRSMSLGGLDPKYSAILMDGAPVASAGSSDINTGRTFEFEQLSVASIETIELNRTPTPDVSGSAVAGVVNLRSKGAFDRKGQQIRYQATLSANGLDFDLKKTPGPGDDKTYKLQPNLTLEYSNVFNDKLGVLAGFNYSWAFAEQKAITFNWHLDNDAGNNATEIPRLNSISLRDSPKPTERRNYNLRLDYKFSNDLSAWGRVDYNTYSGRFFSRDLGFTFSPNGVTSGNNPIVNAPDPDGTGTQRPGVGNTGVEYSLTSQTSTSASASIGGGGGSTNKNGSTATWSGGLAYRRGALTADISGQYSRATNEYKDIGSGWWWSVNAPNLTGLGFTWSRADALDPNMVVTQNSGPAWNDLANFPLGFTVTTNLRSSVDQKYSATAAFKYNFVESPVPLRVNFGYNYNSAIREIQHRQGNSLAHLGADGVAATADDDPALYQDPDYFMSWPWGGNLDHVPTLDRHALAKEHMEHPDWFASLDPLALYRQDLQQYRKTKETIDALYVQPILKFGKLDVAPGFRWEHTRGRFFGPASLTDPQTRAIVGPSVPTNSYEYITTRYGEPRRDQFTDYTTGLKYLHLTYHVNRDLLLRASYNESITRPDLSRLTAGITINNDLADPPRATIGNPDLKPERGRNLYFSVEYYFPEQVGSFTASFARRDIRDLITGVSIDVPDGGSFDDDPFWGTQGGWRLSTSENRNKAHNSSVELSYRQTLNFLPGEFWRNVSVFANHTRLFYDNYDNFRRPRQIANGGVNVRLRDFTIRWNTNWTSEYRTNSTNTTYNATRNNLNPGWGQFNAARLYHDIQLNYNLRRNLTLTLTGRNIFNYPTRTFVRSGSAKIMTRYFEAGSFWTVGVKGTF